MKVVNSALNKLIKKVKKIDHNQFNVMQNFNVKKKRRKKLFISQELKKESKKIQFFHFIHKTCSSQLGKKKIISKMKLFKLNKQTAC